MPKNQNPDVSLQTVSDERDRALADLQAEREAKMGARAELAELQNRIKILERDVAKAQQKRAKLLDAFGRLEEHVNASLLPEIRRLRKKAEEE